MQPPLGDLVVLLNPASEASNWTAIQRAVIERAGVFPKDENTTLAQRQEVKLFADEQPPIVVSLTSAQRWPASEIRLEDCIRFAMARQSTTLYQICYRHSVGEFRQLVEPTRPLRRFSGI